MTLQTCKHNDCIVVFEFPKKCPFCHYEETAVKEAWSDGYKNGYTQGYDDAKTDLKEIADDET